MKENFRIKTLLDYVKEDPGDAFSKYALALEYIKSGNDSEAAVWMEDLFSNQPEYLPNYYHFGKLLERIGATERARNIYGIGIDKAQEKSDLHTKSELLGALGNLE